MAVRGYVPRIVIGKDSGKMVIAGVKIKPPFWQDSTPAAPDKLPRGDKGHRILRDALKPAADLNVRLPP